MASILYKWLLVFALTVSSGSRHPIFVSVTEIEYNAGDKSLEISCKIFTDDLESSLRKQYPTKIDLLDAKYKTAMNPIVGDYVKKHLAIKTDGKPAVLQFVGFEQQEEGIVSYFEVKNVTKVQKIEVTDNILYEYQPQQMGIIHVMVDGERKSTRLNNPETKAAFSF
ncbi:MAG: hypothetical protein JWP81_1416 [Ferruginibacter sp.]|nr:hypothetical protein [Ferruginibacter sp.]